MLTSHSDTPPDSICSLYSQRVVLPLTVWTGIAESLARRAADCYGHDIVSGDTNNSERPDLHTDTWFNETAMRYASFICLALAVLVAGQAIYTETWAVSRLAVEFRDPAPRCTAGYD